MIPTQPVHYDAPDPAALARLREYFLADLPDFSSFDERSGHYWDEERAYKELLGDLYRARLRPLLDDEERGAASAHRLVGAIRKVLTTRLSDRYGPQNLLNWRLFDFLSRMSEDETLLLAGAFRDLLRGPGESPERVERFNAVFAPLVAPAGPAVTRSFPSLFLMLERPDEDIYVRTELFESAHRRLYGAPLFSNKPLDAAEYAAIRAMAVALRTALADWGWRPADMIDVQGFLWCAQEPAATEAPAQKASAGGRAAAPGVPSSAFDRLLASLAAGGLYFSPEAVANYLLALQAKRFVILTGISGTGKTKLAKTVAGHYGHVDTVAEPLPLPEDATLITVRPYMLKHATMVIPVSVTSGMRLPPLDPATNGARLRVLYPDGTLEQSIWRDPTRNVTVLSQSSQFRRWFVDNFQAGDAFVLRAVTDHDSDAASTLEFSRVRTMQRQKASEHLEIVAVRPDWTDSRGLLGYHNPITGTYASTPYLRLLLRATEEVRRAEEEGREPRPYFVVLDEMNLARVEHYFSDFLSCMESGEDLHLHDNPMVESGEAGDEVAVPMRLAIPKNLYFTGTVNIDETTYMFSPKILDRAFTIELSEVDLAALGSARDDGAMRSAPGALHLARLPEQLAPLPPPSTDDWREFGIHEGGALRDRLLRLQAWLADHDRHFGYRVAVETARFVNLALAQTAPHAAAGWVALDLALLQKVLPKLHGTQQELEEVLEGLLAFAREEPALPRMEGKLRRMLGRLQRQGFTAFIG